MERAELQRVDQATQTITRLGTLFQRPALAVPTQPAGEPTEDPAQSMERERVAAFERARHEGHAEGMRAAQEEIRAAGEAARRDCEAAHATALEELEQARTRLAEMLRRLPGMVDAIEDGALEVAAEVAYAAMLRLLGEAPPHEHVAALCQQVLRDQQARPVVVRVAKEDVEAIAALVDTSSVQIQGDARLQAGQCRIDTGLGVDDTGLDVRLEQLRMAFLRGIATARNPG